MMIKRHTLGREKIKPRQVGDAPTIGNVPRTLDEKPPSRKRRSVRNSHKKKLPKHFFAWSALIVTTVVSIAVVSIVKQIRDKVKIAEAANQSDKPINLDLIFKKEENSDRPDLKPDEAIHLLTQALTNLDPGRIRDFFIFGQEHNPKQALADLILIRDAEGEITHTEWLAQKSPDSGNILQVLVYTAIDGNEKLRIAPFTLCLDGKWRIDLDAYLRKCVPPLAEVVLGKSDTSLVRVTIEEDNFYHGKYYDETKWKAYALTSPEITDLIYACVKRGSSQDHALRHIIHSEETVYSTTLSIIKKSDNSSRQFEISKVISQSWIVTEKDFDRSF